jgi:hypothetical protein
MQEEDIKLSWNLSFNVYTWKVQNKILFQHLIMTYI